MEKQIWIITSIGIAPVPHIGSTITSVGLGSQSLEGENNSVYVRSAKSLGFHNKDS